MEVSGTSWELRSERPGRASPLDEIAWRVRMRSTSSLQPGPADGPSSVAVFSTDAALFGCYYTRNPRDGRLFVSSSAALLGEQVGGGDASPPLDYQTGWSGIRLPRRASTASVACYRARRSLTATTNSWCVPSARRHPVEAPYDETLAFLETSFRTILRNLARTGAPPWLSLTGGYDTRSCSPPCGARSSTSRPSLGHPGHVEGGSDVPPLLARDAGVPHRILKREHFNEQRLRTFEEHTALHTVDLDRELISWGQYDELPVDAIVLLGNVFSLGALYFYGSCRQPRHGRREHQDAYGFAEHHADSPAHQHGIREWGEWIEAHPEPGMDWRDRFFWEQWKGGWCAACEQGTDLWRWSSSARRTVSQSWPRCFKSIRPSDTASAGRSTSHIAWPRFSPITPTIWVDP